VTLAEFDLAGGESGQDTFYDISLVDGYNLPMGLIYMAVDKDIPPNLTNLACIATIGLDSATPTSSTNASFPIPYVTTSDADLASWCPWDLQLNPPTKPGDGVYPYPDDNIKRPAFCPCLSACAKTNSASDCCTGSYNDPNVCKPSLYSTQAKSVCPDAYSYAFDDQTSTFVIPTGGGWEVTFCPSGRSTNILKTFGPQLRHLSTTGEVTPQVLSDTQNLTLIQKGEGMATVSVNEKKVGSLGALVVMLAWACLW
jgi:Thaumatin family